MPRCAFAFVLLIAAAARADDIDDLVRGEMARQRIPGLALGIRHHGVVVRAQGYGWANVELGAAVHAGTVFQSGSLGKQFTAMAVMLLVEEGKLGLDDPISRFFAGSPELWRGITVRHLLNHTSGIKDYGQEDLDYRRDYSEDELVQVAQRLPADFPPGTRWSYSNTGYVLLGIIVRSTSGRFYGDFLAERVFGPLGMTITRVISEHDLVLQRSAGYLLRDSEWKNQEWVAPQLNTTADGSLYLTALDLLRWDEALERRQLLGAASYQAWWTPVRLADGTTFPYGFGWSLGEQRGHPTIEHGGSWQGFRTAIVRYEPFGLTVIVLANLASADPESLAHEIAGRVEPALRVPQDAAPSDPDPLRTERLRAVLTAWSRSQPHDAMATALRRDQPQTARDRAPRQRTGAALEGATTFEYRGEDTLGNRVLERLGETIERIVYCGLRTADGATAWRFYLNARGEVAAFESNS